MLKRIYGLLTREERKRGVWVALSVLFRALLDFAGVAALIPILLAVFGEKSELKSALAICGAALLFILLKNMAGIALARFQSRFLLDLYKAFPAKLKIYFEQITVSGLTFKYRNGNPLGLCKAKSLTYVTTSGGPIIADFGYTYEKKTGEQTVLYQFALAMNDETHAKPDFKDNGMLYILKLSDNSVVIIDGANSIQMTNDRRDELMQMLWDITGSQEGDTVRVAGWYITHAHGDHYGGFLHS